MKYERGVPGVKKFDYNFDPWTLEEDNRLIEAMKLQKKDYNKIYEKHVLNRTY